jgi:hypothetical protein
MTKRSSFLFNIVIFLSLYRTFSFSLALSYFNPVLHSFILHRLSLPYLLFSLLSYNIFPITSSYHPPHIPFSVLYFNPAFPPLTLIRLSLSYLLCSPLPFNPVIRFLILISISFLSSITSYFFFKSFSSLLLLLAFIFHRPSYTYFFPFLSYFLFIISVLT